MADALASFVVDQLTTLFKDEINRVVGVKDEIDKLTITFNAIQAVLQDAEHQQFKNKSVRLWLKQFKNVAYDMDDVLDEWITEMLIRSQIKGIQNAPKDEGKKKVHSLLHSLCSCFGEVGLRHDIGARIKKIRERVDSIANEKDKYQLIQSNNDHKGPDHLETSSIIDESVVYGRDSEKDNIINKLLGGTDGSSSSNQQETGLSNPTVISIVGMGGLGKTTLTQLVFNNEQVKNHFDKTMWVCVSNPFDRTRVAEAIIKEAGGNAPSNPEWNELHNSLSESVTGKRFLLVLDDVWCEVPTKWESLQHALRSGAQGSRVLVTTRKEKVAKIMESTYIYDLKILSDTDCWSLIRRKAFAGVNKEKENLETFNQIGFEIAKKCKGLPLAAKALGSLLCLKNTKSEWENVHESEIWEIIEDVENNFLKPALLLSYLDLPSYLKPCFTYCSIFPKDYKMQKDVLIKLWMAQGFLNSTKGKTRDDLEMIGEEYFNNLVLRSLFQDIEFINGNIFSVKMHDLLHDFAQFLMENECNHKNRHLSLFGGSSFNAMISEDKNLRTLQLSVQELPSSFFGKFRCLRVLCLKHSDFEKFSSKIGTLIHLRYLDLSVNWKLKELPESITTLYNLQTLKLADCGHLCKLPDEMWKLNNLRHLDIEGCRALTYLPQGIGKLTCLRTLNYFPLSGGDTQGSAKIQELKDLKHLEGKLKIYWFSSVKTTKSEASEARLKNMNHLRVLVLEFEWTGADKKNSLTVADRINGELEGLEPPTKLERLILNNYFGSKFPSWIGDKSMLSKLKDLTLYACDNCIEFPDLGRLPSLEYLLIISMQKIKQIGFESYQPFGGVMKEETLFPKLKDLQLREMDNLEELFGNGVAAAEELLGDMNNIIEIMPCLIKLEIYKCPKLKSLPPRLLNLEELEYHDSLLSLYHFSSFPKLKCLTIHGSSVARLSQGLLAQFKGLEKLEITFSNNLICIPEEVKHLTNLQELYIWWCEKLVRRCRKDEGEDWSIISHIPNIFINGTKIQ